jgi:hypothetical protein
MAASARPTRGRLIHRTRLLLERAHTPRFDMAVIMLITGLAGLFCSFVLLEGGVHELWIRYPLSVLFAYLAFLICLWVWIHTRSWETWNQMPDLGSGMPTSGAPSGTGPTCSGHEISLEPPLSQGGEFGGGGASGIFGTGEPVSSSAPSGLMDGLGSADGDVEALPLMLILGILALLAALAAAMWAAVSVILSAPQFLAELTVDMWLAGGLLRHLRTLHAEHWLRAALRKTVWLFVGVALLSSLAGALLQAHAPHAKTLREAVQRTAPAQQPPNSQSRP